MIKTIKLSTYVIYEKLKIFPIVCAEGVKGAGKTTALLQLLDHFKEMGEHAVYINNETIDNLEEDIELDDYLEELFKDGYRVFLIDDICGMHYIEYARPTIKYLSKEAKFIIAGNSRPIRVLFEYEDEMYEGVSNIVKFKTEFSFFEFETFQNHPIMKLTNNPYLPYNFYTKEKVLFSGVYKDWVIETSKTKPREIHGALFDEIESDNLIEFGMLDQYSIEQVTSLLDVLSYHFAYKDYVDGLIYNLIPKTQADQLFAKETLIKVQKQAKEHLSKADARHILSRVRSYSSLSLDIRNFCITLEKDLLGELRLGEVDIKIPELTLKLYMYKVLVKEAGLTETVSDEDIINYIILLQ